MLSSGLNLILKIASVAILLTLARPASAAEYDGVREAGLQILRERPPEQYLYIGVGRSPTPIIAFLKSMAGDKAASQIAYSSGALNEKLAMTKRHEMDAYLASTLSPLVERAQGRRLLFIDYVVNGGFHSSLRVIDDFLIRHHPGSDLTFMVLINQGSLISNLDWLKRENLILLDRLDFELERKIRSSAYDQVSPVGGWRLDQGPIGSAGAQHEAYLERMRKQVSADVTFATYSGSRCSNVFAR